MEGSTRRMRLGEILVASGVLTDSQLEDALATQTAEGRRQRLGQTIIETGLAGEEAIAAALAAQLGYDTVDLTTVGPEPAALQRVPRKLAERHHALPLRITDDNQLVVAMSDPTNIVALDDLKLTSGLRGVVPTVATESAVTDALRRAYGSDQRALDMVDALRDGEVVSVDDDATDDLSDVAGMDDQPVIRLANAILADAVRTRTSDIHVEPERDSLRIRYRIDGMLRETMRIPRHIGPALVSRLKIMSSLDIAERRRPQDGRSMVRVEGQEVDLRVSTMPTLFGETVVMRLLRKGTQRIAIDELGMAPDHREAFEHALARPQGLIVITGPTGSGKTTTLYAGLTEITDEVRNIITLEDPIEYQLDGVNQTQVNPKIGLTFAAGLRTVLRQDPDVVLVGEIRDRETAELALEASMTGHLVLATLHTNDAPSTVVRLRELDVDRFLMASSLLLVSAQRLTRIVCRHCAEPTEPDERTMRLLGLAPADLEGAELRHGTGCQVCDQTGYLGRVAAMEVMRLTPELREAIMAGASELELGRIARAQGMRTLREDAIGKAMAGLTTLEEVVRTTPEPTTQIGQVPLDTPRVSVPPSPATPADGDAPAEHATTTDGGAPRSGQTAHEPGPADTADVEPGSADADPTSNGDGPPRRVLVVDDDPSIRALLSTLLDGYEVIGAEDGEGGVRLAEEKHPDAVILDLKLPDFDGIEVTKLLRSDARFRHTPILMITGVEDPALEVEGLLAGVDDYLTKPFDETVLRTRLGAALRRAGMR